MIPAGTGQREFEKIIVFAMIMLVDITKLNSDFATMADGLTELGQTMGVKIHTMHEDIFNCMHHI